MLAKILSGGTIGLDSGPVTVEVDISSQSLPAFHIVGLPSKSVEESKERVRSAIKNSGAEFPQHRITVNLAPADLPKDGPAYDFPIALGILIASDQLNADVRDCLFFGQLSLDGTLTHTKGVLPMALLAKEKKYKAVFLPATDAREAAVVDRNTIYPVTSLISMFHHLKGASKIKSYPHTPFSKLQGKVTADFDLSDIKGQEQAKRALEISAAGGHNLYMNGVPGAGKTMLARSLPGILPNLTEQEAMEVTKIYSVTGNIPEGSSVIKIRPFRSPHHTTSRIGLIGGGTRPMPGEVSLAHRGVLFADELPEFPRHVLEALRQPLEDGIVSISRASGTISYPAKFVLVTASNPCPCGYFGDPVKRCLCNPNQIYNYKKRVSGPILDRIDLHIDLPAVKVEKLIDDKKSESSEKIKQRVQKARDVQTKRFRKTRPASPSGRLVCNGDMGPKDIKELVPLSTDCLKLLKEAVVSLHLSARTFHRVIKVARTVADLENSQDLRLHHLAESLQYRPKDSQDNLGY